MSIRISLHGETHLLENAPLLKDHLRGAVSFVHRHRKIPPFEIKSVIMPKTSDVPADTITARIEGLDPFWTPDEKRDLATIGTFILHCHVRKAMSVACQITGVAYGVEAANVWSQTRG
jgi:hypothetical protein